jgi:hypothetical protein
MSSFREFMDEIGQTPSAMLPSSSRSLQDVQSELTSHIGSLLAPLAVAESRKQKFGEEVAGVIGSEPFISEFSSRVGEPVEHETEDAFVERATTLLRRMLHDRFGIKGQPK